MVLVRFCQSILVILKIVQKEVDLTFLLSSRWIKQLRSHSLLPKVKKIAFIFQNARHFSG